MSIVEVRAVAFDLDDTLAPSKSLVPSRTVALLGELLDELPVCVISGGRFAQFRDQLLSQLSERHRLSALHLMPTCGTRYYRWNPDGADWKLVYGRDMSKAQRRLVIDAVERAARDLGLWEPDHRVSGDRIEDRGSQVTYSALGQQAGVAEKKAWDPKGAKRAALAERLVEMLPDLEVRAGGSTSIDITERGVDKAYGIRQLAESLDIDMKEIFFVGDRLEPGGNDYPVRALGVQTRQVADHVETVEVIEDLLRGLRGGPASRWAFPTWASPLDEVLAAHAAQKVDDGPDLLGLIGGGQQERVGGVDRDDLLQAERHDQPIAVGSDEARRTERHHSVLITQDPHRRVGPVRARPACQRGEVAHVIPPALSGDDGHATIPGSGLRDRVIDGDARSLRPVCLQGVRVLGDVSKDPGHLGVARGQQVQQDRGAHDEDAGVPQVAATTEVGRGQVRRWLLAKAPTWRTSVAPGRSRGGPTSM